MTVCFPGVNNIWLDPTYYLNDLMKKPLIDGANIFTLVNFKTCNYTI